MDSSLSSVGSLFGIIHNFFVASTPDMPPEAWWVAAAILLILGAGAVVDSFKAIVPDTLMFFGMIAIVGLQGVYVAWPFAAHQMTWGLVAAAIIWAVNEIWYQLFKQDALGLGDAKWSMLAVTCFGGWPVLFAWGVGAVFGSIWIGALKLIGKPTAHVHFAPFLFVGLIAGIWAIRMDGMAPLLTLYAPQGWHIN